MFDGVLVRTNLWDNLDILNSYFHYNKQCYSLAKFAAPNLWRPNWRRSVYSVFCFIMEATFCFLSVFYVNLTRIFSQQRKKTSKKQFTGRDTKEDFWLPFLKSIPKYSSQVLQASAFMLLFSKSQYSLPKQFILLGSINSKWKSSRSALWPTTVFILSVLVLFSKLSNPFMCLTRLLSQQICQTAYILNSYFRY